MFSGLFDYAMRRTPLQALGFFIVYSLGFIIIIAVAGAVGGTWSELIFGVDQKAVTEASGAVGSIAALIFVVVMALVIAVNKQTFNAVTLSLIVLSVVMGLFGVFAGMVPVAILTTRRAN